MPFLHINSGPSGPRLHKTDTAVRPALAKALAADSGPVIIMTHGYKFAPGHGDDCPHEHILSLSPRPHLRKRISWPRKLGFGADLPGEGVGIAFGWSGRGTIWQAYRQATAASASLASLIEDIHSLAPGRQVHLMAHSLGARVILSALRRLPENSVGRLILLCGAEYTGHAVRCLNTGAGRTAEVFNITSRENDLFDFLLERLIAAPRAGDRCIGAGLPDQPRVVTVQLDHAGSLDVLARAGFDIAPPAASICHWSSYLRPGVFDLYHALLRHPGSLPLAQLRAKLPDRPDHRWSRLLAPTIRVYTGLTRATLPLFPSLETRSRP
jgi:pimeloyl-ACP methyl ester carboxylesterase